MFFFAEARGLPGSDFCEESITLQPSPSESGEFRPWLSQSLSGIPCGICRCLRWKRIHSLESWRLAASREYSAASAYMAVYKSGSTDVSGSARAYSDVDFHV